MAGYPISHLGSLSQSEVRIVLLGDFTADKSKVIKSILGCKTLTGEKNGLCTLHTGEEEGKKITVVNTPGWNRTSIEQTAENIKAEIVRSVSLCPPGPDILLLVLPVNDLSEELSTSEITEAQKHVELLSERVWKYTAVLFDCDEGVKKSAIKEHFRSSEKILEKCKGRHLVLQRSDTQMSRILKKIERLVEENRGDFFIPQIYYELIQSKTQVAGESGIRQRRGSYEKIPPNLEKEKGDSDEKKETAVVTKPMLLPLDKSLNPFAVILMGIIGALIGSVAGAENGVSGACFGLVIGIVVGVLLAVLTIYIYVHIYSHYYPQQPHSDPISPKAACKTLSGVKTDENRLQT